MQKIFWYRSINISSIIEYALHYSLMKIYLFNNILAYLFVFWTFLGHLAFVVYKLLVSNTIITQLQILSSVFFSIPKMFYILTKDIILL